MRSFYFADYFRAGGWAYSVGFGGSAEVLKIVVNDTIQPITEEYISRAIDEAQRRNDQAVLIEINTPGGLVDSTRKIIEKITIRPVPVIHLCDAQRQPRRVCGIFYSGIGRHRGHGSGNEHGRGASGGDWAAARWTM